MTESMEKRALVLGATGGIGGEMTERLLRDGWPVRALVRDAGGAARRWGRPGPEPEWWAGDAMDREAVASAATGTRLIVHAVNPPGYRDWDRLVMPMLENTIAAAARAGARVLLPGNLYVFGPDAFPRPAEDAPQDPVTRKGRIRALMERRLRVASEEEGVPVLIVRAGDFFGPRAANNWFSQGLVKPGRPVRGIANPGRPGLGHQWAYLPDVAETMIALLRDEVSLGRFAAFNMDGHWDADGSQMAQAIQRVLGRRVPVRRFPWWLVRALPMVPLFREIAEMRYLWQVPIRMRNDRLLHVLGTEPHTPLDAAVRATLMGLGCVERRPVPKR